MKYTFIFTYIIYITSPEYSNYIEIYFVRTFYLYREIPIVNPYMEEVSFAKIRFVLKHLIHVNQIHVALELRLLQMAQALLANVLAHLDSSEILTKNVSRYKDHVSHSIMEYLKYSSWYMNILVIITFSFSYSRENVKLMMNVL